MNDSLPPGPPAWVHKRDGQLVPFDADKISRALFAASEELGQPDAFLARELADGVVHFLTLESEGATPTTEQIAEVVIKVVRELGQPALAEAFARFGQERERLTEKPQETEAAQSTEVVLRFSRGAPLSAVLPACVRAFSLQTVFTRDLAAAQSAGLLTLADLDIPNELVACLLGSPSDVREGPIAALAELRRFVGRFVVLDGPEYLLAAHGRPNVGAFVRDLVVSLRLSRLQGIVNLNSVAPPSWAGELAEGPLFASHQRKPHSEQLRELAGELAKEFLSANAGTSAVVRIDWHIGERDFTEAPAQRERLRQLARLALDGAPLAFVFDRPRRPTALAEGIDRQHPAVLMTVGLHLPQLALQPGIDGEPAKFLAKLGSLARLALSAGVQKREYLRHLERSRRRQHEPEASATVTNGFLLDRARLVVAPVGLDCVVQSFVKKGLSSGGAALDFARQIVLRLRDVLRQDGRTVHLDTCLDGPLRLHDAQGSEPNEGWPLVEDVAGLTAWDPTAPLKSQLRSAGALHGVAEHGTLALFQPEDEARSQEQLTEWLHTAWKQTDVVRLRLVRRSSSSRQLMFETVRQA
ncbi:MAG TPA: ATP cone domain-containing protein [Gemmataceae bacterium]